MNHHGFNLVRPLSSGHGSSAYLAYDSHGNPVRFVEFSMLESAGSGQENDSSGLRLLLKRAKMVAHPSILPIALITHANECRIAATTSYCHEDSILNCDRSKIDLGESIVQIADALVSMHRMGVSHGCLSCSKIYMHPDSTGVCVLDLLDGFLENPVNQREGALAFAQDVSLFGATIRELLRKFDLTGCDLVKINHLLEDISAESWIERPSMDQVAIEIRRAMDGDFSRPGSSSYSSAINDHTIAVDSDALEQVAKEKLVPTDLRSMGRFEIQRALGEGGMGAVFLAKDTSSENLVAIKVLSQRMANDEKAARRFAKEARLLSQVEHPAIARLIEFNRWEGAMYLAMEYVAGGCLADVTRSRRSVPELLVANAIADCALGLACAHQNGMVHRDIKPANLLLTERGERSFSSGKLDKDSSDPLIKIADFGLAKHFDAAESIVMTQTGMILGTPHYMAPEQCRGGEVGPATDIYALGVTLYQCLTGKLPYDGESAIEIFRLHCDSPVPDIRKSVGSISDAMKLIVEKCLEKNPFARYQDASQLHTALEEYLAGKSSSIALHPALPEVTDKETKGQLTYQFQWKLLSSAESLWPYVSNTDRVNHAIGLPAVRYRTFQDPKLGVRRMATVRAMGMTMEWEEHPYEWIEGRRLSVLRQFPSGPFHWFTNVVELKPQSDGGTVVVQTLKMLPRNLMGRIFAKFQIGNKSERNFGKVYESIDAYLQTNEDANVQANAFSKTKLIDREQKRRLSQRFERVRANASGIDPKVVDLIEQVLEHASDLEVARVRPLALSERFGLDPKEVVHVCLLAAREGAMVMLWDILCPTCRIPSDVKETLKGLADHGHCEACNVDFELDFAKSIELIFRAHPEVRTSEIRTYCVGGPAFSKHVVAQVRLQPDERFQMELGLSEGEYRLRGPQLPFVIEFRVTRNSRVGRWDLDLSKHPSSYDIPSLRAGQQIFAIVNTEAYPRQIRIERVASRAGALTAAEAAQLPYFREWFPEEVLSPGQMVGVTNVTLLACRLMDVSRLYQELPAQAACSQILRQLQSLAAIVADHSGCVIKSTQDGLNTVFPGVSNALSAATKIAEQSSQAGVSICQAIHQGAAVVATINERLDYFGETPQLLDDLLRASQSGEILITEACLNDWNVPAMLHSDWQIEMATPMVTWPKEKLMSCRLGKMERTSKNF